MKKSETQNKLRRKFNDRYYKFYDSYNTKTEAQEEAGKLRVSYAPTTLEKKPSFTCVVLLYPHPQGRGFSWTLCHRASLNPRCGHISA